MFTKSGLTAGAVALMLGAAILATSAPAQARGGYHGISPGSTGGIAGTRFAGRQELIVPLSTYRFGEGYRRFDRDGYRRFGFWHGYTWFRHFHHRRFHRYGFEPFYEG